MKKYVVYFDDLSMLSAVDGSCVGTCDEFPDAWQFVNRANAISAAEIFLLNHSDRVNHYYVDTVEVTE